MNKGFLLIDTNNNVLYIPGLKFRAVNEILKETGFSADHVERCQVKSGVRLAVARYLKAKTEEEYYELKKKEERNEDSD